MASVELIGLTKAYPTPEGVLTILRDLTLTIKAGEAVAVTGPSGCGKSTLLSMLGVLEEPSGGSLRLFGEDPYRLDETARAFFRNARIGFVFQYHHLLPQCTVEENVLIPKLAAGRVVEQDVVRARGLLEQVGLSSRLMHRPGRLSGGERQRVALCRAVINSPDLLLADEPTGNLDPATADEVGDLLLRLVADGGTTLVCVTHSESLADRFPRRLRLRDGGVVDSHAAVEDA
ncbi:MAG: ABC transporter ATP-binding protein [Planctomycetota bacterium]